MNKTMAGGLIALLALLAMSYLMFQNFGKPATLERVRLIYTVLDSNGDGQLDAEELEAASERLLQLDRNNDGVISEDEVFPDTDQGNSD